LTIHRSRRSQGARAAVCAGRPLVGSSKMDWDAAVHEDERVRTDAHPSRIRTSLVDWCGSAT
jgi:hypothetical protein